MEEKMKAIRINQKCETSELVPKSVKRPSMKDGHVLIQIKAFGINESEITSRKGESSSDFSFPRTLGIEGVGIIAESGKNSSFAIGQKVATMMGGLGRSIDGSYAEYMLVKEANVIPLETQLDWGTIGALPEMLQTAYGSLTKGLLLKEKETLFIRGGTSTVGLMAAVLAKEMGAVVIATSRNSEKLTLLKEYRVDHALLDNVDLKKHLNEIVPKGVDKVLELVGFSTLFEDMSFLKEGGTVCFTGALGGQWTLDTFSPFMIPSGIFFTSYAGDATDLPAEMFNSVLKKIENHEISVPIAEIYHGLEEVSKAQENLESGKYIGKHVVVV